MRIVGDEIRARGGQVEDYDDFDAHLLGIYDDKNDDFEPKLYIGDSDGGANLRTFNGDQSPNVQELGSLGQPIAGYSGDGSNEIVTFFEEGSNTIFMTGQAISTGGLVQTEAPYVGTGVTNFQGQGFHNVAGLALLQKGGSDINLYLYNTITFAVWDTLAGKQGITKRSKVVHQGPFQADDLYWMAYDSIGSPDAHIVRKWTALTQTWSNFATLSASGTLGYNIGLDNLCVFNNELYAFGLNATSGRAEIFKITSGSITRVRDIAGSVNWQELAVLNGFLYYLYNTSSTAFRLGRFNGTTWTDNYVDNPVPAIAGGEARMASTDDDMIIARVSSSAEAQGIYKTTSTDPSDWQLIASHDGFDGHPLVRGGAYGFTA